MNRLERRLFIGLLVLALVVVSRGSQAMHGNAPYYLAISHSLAHDFDLDLRNQFDPSGGYIFYGTMSGGFARPGRNGRLYPTQGVGFAAAITPVFVAAETVASLVPEPVLRAVRWDRARCTRDLISAALALLGVVARSPWAWGLSGTATGATLRG